MSRVLVFVEGQTEETFVRDLLVPYFSRLGIYLTPILAQTSPGHKGGIVSYGKVKHQLTRLCRQDQGAYVTTMMDYYGLPNDFPGLDGHVPDAHEQVARLELALQQDIDAPNFIPNLMLHEFEALLFSAPEKFAEWLDDQALLAPMAAIRGAFATPEHINNSPQTAPSKRILALVPHYKKTVDGPLIAEDIGLDTIRAQCPHFNNWIERLLALPR
ncbi:DUF4276 family protein [Aeromonas caviae]|uniref:DUF4276 family protein n=1 Tax=Aeromonas caviae TaxID=648 RepID=A0AAV4YNA0_AERCA|nr:DUF4276 family protein [Aeromonas caviae]GJA33292.1 hypothetical protein KAM341_29700 [Aeromonas caviae]GJA37776.1 hypothetical protein KAM342_30190 [Aeromonas caviae]GJA42299.1 hypothetical protein KAM343_30950 [Aeromonas caviae]GJA51376.1 hypothetical protein KAM347_31670 [Aeromonas caviae]GJA60184.1 hypothetical protein KAM350_31770 [Aeromonas caviae]